MQITIIKNNKLTLFTLPQDNIGSHWITDFENGKKINLINIEATNNGWQILSNSEVFLVDKQDVMVPFALLKEYQFYTIKNNYRNEKYYLYCSPVYDRTFREIGVKENQVFSVGNDKECTVCYQFPGLAKIAFNIEKKEENYILTVPEKNTLVFVNQKRVLDKSRILYGDIIFLYGLKVILMRRDGRDYFLINNPNGMVAESMLFTNLVTTPVSFVEKNEEAAEDLYEEDYFYRTPHFFQAMEKFVLQIDAPPSRKEEDKTPAILTIGPMVTMSMMSVVMLLSTMSSVRSGDRALKDSITSIVMCVVMLLSSLLWPVLTKKYQKFSDKMYEKKRQDLYKKYLEKKEHEIELELNKQRRLLIENNLTVKECQDIIKAHNTRLWQRRIVDEDFLTLPVGIGNLPMQMDVKYPEEHFSLAEDNLLDLVYDLGGKERLLEEVPITYSFYENVATGIVGDIVTNKEFIDRLLLQMMTHYSYDELKIVMFTSMENENVWDYIKTLPHNWSNDHNFRFFGSSNDEYREIIYYLDKIFNERVQEKNDTRKVPHYVIITDAIKSIDSYDFIKNILSSEENCGFSIIMLVDRVSACPNECKNFIHVSQKECAIFNSVLNSSNQTFRIDASPIEELYNCSKELANIKVEIKSEIETALPDVYHFLEMYQVGKVEQLNSLERWKRSNPMLSLQTPVGIGKSGEIISLDLHEKYHGPHGLIAGTTGSGKSEFIITYVLSLAVNYSPLEVQIILIDYKGGGLALAFQNENYSLPHIAGIMTNLDGNELNRSLASIESEIKRRQRMFNEARSLTNESTIDIYKYQKLYREGRLQGKEQIAHLFIISDEFAELKEQQPEFMDKLISVARVGRSLGVHLILATQKPGGVVDSQIWSNTRFRVCLKVQDTSDSQEVLKKPDAAYLKKTGRFYLQVGYDEVYTLGQSAWAGGKYYPSSIFKRELDTSVNMINNIGLTTMTRESAIMEQTVAQGEEITSIVKYLSDLARSKDIAIPKLWLEKIPALIYIDSLKSKYNYKKVNYTINPVIGEYDDPDSQNQYLLTLPLSESGNTILYGIADSGKEMFLTTLLYSSITTYSVYELQYYLLDFGSESLRSFDSAPHVGDVVFLNDVDKITNLFKMLNEEIENRKKAFAPFGGSLKNYLQSARKAIAQIVVVINNYEAFSEAYEDLNEELATLTREAFKFGIYFILTASNETNVRMKIKQNFNLLYAFQQNNDSDYFNIFGNVRGKIPAKIKGRGLFKKDKIYEFQTASIVEEEKQISYITNVCNKLSTMYQIRAKRIPVLPEIVDYDYIENELTNKVDMVVGVAKEKLNIEKFNFSKNAIQLISAYELEDMDAFLNAMLRQIKYLNYYDILFINTTERNMQSDILNGRYVDKNIDAMFIKIADYIEKVYAIYETHNYEESAIKDQRKMVCFLYGIYNFINKLSEDSKKKLAEIMRKNSQIHLVSFVIVDNPDVIKAYAFEEWFKKYSDTARGIWIGSGIAEQTLFKVSKIEREDRLEITNQYGYVINNAKITKIKLLTDFNSNKQK